MTGMPLRPRRPSLAPTLAANRLSRRSPGTGNGRAKRGNPDYTIWGTAPELRHRSICATLSHRPESPNLLEKRPLAIPSPAPANPLRASWRNLGNIVRPFDARQLGLAFLVPVFEVFRRIAFCLPATLAPNDAVGHGCIAAIVLGALATVVALIARGRQGHQAAVPFLARFAALVGLASFAAMAAALLAGKGQPASYACAIGAYGLLGCSLAALFLGWVDAYSRHNPPTAALVVALSVFIGNLPLPLLIALKNPWAMGAILCVCLLVSCTLLARLSHGIHTPGPAAEKPLNSEGLSPTSDAERPGWASLFAGSSSATAFGFVTLFFSWGIMAVPPHAYASDHKSWVYLVGNLTAVAMALWFVLTLRSNPRYATARQKAFFILPVLAMFVGYFSFIRMLNTAGALKDVLSVGFNMSVGGFTALFMGTAAMRLREKGTPCVLAVGPVLVFALAEYATGVLAYATLGNDAMYIQIVLVTLYIVALSFMMTRKASLNDETRIAKRVGQLATERGLSAREHEILLLLASDYSVERIAEQLTISTETVRTHKKRIYAKVGVHKHEDLMRTVRSQG